LYSLNYERKIGLFGVRVGASYLSISADDQEDGCFFCARLFAVPIAVSFLGLGAGSHALEIGAAVTLVYLEGTTEIAEADGVTAFASGLVGYRFQGPGSGLQFRVGASVLAGTGGAVPWPYLSLGIGF